MLHLLSFRARKSLPLHNARYNTSLKPSVPSPEGSDDVFLDRVMYESRALLRVQCARLHFRVYGEWCFYA